MEFVLLVDEQDNELGVMEKMQAHEEALLHRAISVFIFNSKGELLLQRRAAVKYHSAMLWTNACCTHPRPEEPMAAAAKRRLVEEMNISCDLVHQFSFIYHAQLDNGLTEHELDHVFFGYTDQEPIPNPDEVADWKYISMAELTIDITSNPDQYTEWFKLIFDRIKQENNERFD